MQSKNIKTDWDLSPIFKSDNDKKIQILRKKVIRESYKFIDRWKKTNDYLKYPETLRIALDEYESWLRNYGALGDETYYFHLKTSLNQNDPALKAKENKVIEFSKKIENDIQFFELRIAKVPSRLQKKFLNHKSLSHYKHFLEKLFNQSKYLLTEPEEKILNLKSQTSYTNWVRMLSGFLSKETSKVLDEDEKTKEKTFSDLLGLMNSKNKKVRDNAANSFNKILLKHLDSAENEINSVLLNKKTDDELRKFTRPDSARHIADDIDMEVVDSLVEVVTEKFEMSKKYYELKAKLLELPKLAYHERSVEYGKLDKKYPYDYSFNLIAKVLKNLDSDFFQLFQDFINEGRVDVYPKKDKTSGAFCTYGLLIHPSFILLNWNERLNDVLTFAHELGHGINNELIRKVQNSLNFGTPISTAEVASTFMEDFVLQELLKEADDELKLALMMMKLNEEVSTIFRQIAFYNFETELHKKFREIGYLSKEEIGKIFQQYMISYMGPYVEQSNGSENWWTYIGHFRKFFYVYSYASGLLISKSLQASVKENPEFIMKVKDFLSTGLSDSPKNIFAKMGIDITDKKFWEKGLGEVEDLLSETEKLAIDLGKI